MIHYLLCRVCGYAWFVDTSDVADTWEDMRLREKIFDSLFVDD